ncbi:D5 N like family protein, partial [Gallibacterium anatis]
MMNGKLKKAPFLKDQPNTPLNEMIILAGSEAWQAWGNGNGQYWHLLTERIRSDYKQKPVILGYDQ